jgi:hypothetical protein
MELFSLGSLFNWELSFPYSVFYFIKVFLVLNLNKKYFDLAVNYLSLSLVFVTGQKTLVPWFPRYLDCFY